MKSEQQRCHLMSIKSHPRMFNKVWLQPPRLLKLVWTRLSGLLLWPYSELGLKSTSLLTWFWTDHCVKDIHVLLGYMPGIWNLTTYPELWPGGLVEKNILQHFNWYAKMDCQYVVNIFVVTAADQVKEAEFKQKQSVWGILLFTIQISGFLLPLLSFYYSYTFLILFLILFIHLR